MRKTIIYSGHAQEDAPHTEGVALMLYKEATKSLIEWESVSSRIITARFHTKVWKVTVIQCYAPTNEAEEECKTDFYERLQAVINNQARRDVLLMMGDFNAKISSDNTGRGADAASYHHLITGKFWFKLKTFNTQR